MSHVFRISRTFGLDIFRRFGKRSFRRKIHREAEDCLQRSSQSKQVKVTCASQHFKQWSICPCKIWWSGMEYRRPCNNIWYIYLSIYICLSISIIYPYLSFIYINLSIYLSKAIFVEQCSQPWSPACRGVSCTCWPTGSAWRTSQPPAFSLVTRILAQESKPESKAEFLSHFRFLHLNFAYFLWKTSQKSLSVKIINIVTGSVDEMMAVNLYGRLFQPHGMGHFIG